MYETTGKPNIFKYATKELSQDAVICWLIEWAYHDEPGRERLRECGQKFIEALFAKHDKEIPRVGEKPKVWPQDNSIDVLSRIGEYVLLVEDKTGTKDHSGQLKRYYDKVLKGKTKAKKVGKENILPIYLKTGNQSLFDRMRIENSTPYKVFNRCDFWKVVEPCQDAHPILDDFRDHLKSLEDDTQSYGKWGQDRNGKVSHRSCEGFFRKLEEHLVVFDGDNPLVGFDNDSVNKYNPINCWTNDWVEALHPPWGWNYVPNQSGGFAGFWWYYKTVKSCGHDVELYLQLEINRDKPDHSKLCFRVKVKEDTKGLTREIRKNCYDRILEAGKVGSPGDLVCGPNRMGTGYTMTVALWDNKDGQKPWLVLKSNGEVDIQATIKNLMEAQSVLDRAEGILC